MLTVTPFPFLCHYENPGACYQDNAQPDADSRPVLSVDFSNRLIDGSKYLFATGGGDTKARIWKIDGNVVRCERTLSRHSLTVNCVRFSPDGELLATASDDIELMPFPSSPLGPPG
ncbi:putative chromatin assembly factor 1 subunit B [Paratrimastix pyriformis]|uniref:Chromatin assembly factor 1 subunit B n=1 Tax=Paratrimastix pyriformis TaxID=342808 RepID=A0ABQ8U9D7_9EUKA|nr:putative chromatin assembly factor 1 subunit B [Paratrimastix pyriformis]